MTTEENNEMLAKGFKYFVKGEWKVLESKDPRDRMPNTTGTIRFFTEEEEAKAYAEKQVWVFNSNVHGKVEKLVYKKR